MKSLVIAEKPSAAQSIASALLSKPMKRDGYIEGDQLFITWAFGHLLSLAEPEAYDEKYKKWRLDSLPIIPDRFKLVPNPKTRKQLMLIKELASKSDVIINACDSGREGELIFGYIMQYLKLNKPVQRLWTSSLTPDAIRTAFREMKSGAEYQNLLKAAIARNESDWIVGINGTRAFSSKHKELFSVGRVQTPVLAMLVDRQKEIEEFTPITYYEIVAHFKQQETQYKGIRLGERILDSQKAKEIAEKVKNQNGLIISYEIKEKKEYAPKLYDLTLLQKEANIRFGFSAQKTLNLAQALYEDHKAITYPRTNSNYVNETEISYMQKVFRILLKSEYQNLAEKGEQALVHPKNKNLCRPEKVEDHHAILPTEKLPNRLSKDEEKIYDLIVKRFLTHFYQPAEYKMHSIITEVAGERFRTVVKEVVNPGWKIIYGDKKHEKEQHQDGENQEYEVKDPFILSAVKEAYCDQANSAEKETSPPKWFTEGSLVAAMQTAGKEIEDEELKEAMKDRGLGTPATRAGIIERLKKVGYIYAQGKKLMVTEKGKRLIELVRTAGVGLLTSAEMTGEWEKRLNDIAKNSSEIDLFYSNIRKFAYLIVEKVEKQMALEHGRTSQNGIAPCPAPQCDGKIIEGKKGYGCSNWQKGCKFVIWKTQYGKRLSEKSITELITKGRTRFLKFKSKNDKTYEARLILREPATGETALEFKTKKQNA